HCPWACPRSPGSVGGEKTAASAPRAFGLWWNPLSSYDQLCSDVLVHRGNECADGIALAMARPRYARSCSRCDFCRDGQPYVLRFYPRIPAPAHSTAIALVPDTADFSSLPLRCDPDGGAFAAHRLRRRFSGIRRIYLGSFSRAHLS